MWILMYWALLCGIEREIPQKTFLSQYHGATQDSVVSPTFFSVIVDAVVRKWLADVMDDIESAIEGLQGGDVSRLTSLIYATTA